MSAITANAQITFTQNLLPAYTVGEGGNVTMSVIAAGPNVASFKYTWQVSLNNGISYSTLSNDGVYSGQGTPSLTLTGVPASYNGYKYVCLISDPVGPGFAYSDQTTLTVAPTYTRATLRLSTP